jgi:hypothetical protein
MAQLNYVVGKRSLFRVLFGCVPAIWMGVLKKGTQHSAAHVELVFVPIIGFLLHSYIFTNVVLHFGMVMVNTLLNSGKIRVNCKHRRTLVCPIRLANPALGPADQNSVT